MYGQGGGKDGELGDGGDRVVPQSFNLTTFSIVGVKGGTRKRPRGRLSGSWWTGCGWGPGARCPWKVGRRRIFVSESPAEEVEVMEIESILKERAGLVVELSTDYEMDIQEGHMMEAVRARESGTDFQQTGLMDTDTELWIALTSDKDKDCVTGYWAQECPFPGTEERASCDQGHHHHPGVAGLAEEGRDQASDTTAEVGSGQDITGKFSKFQLITSFWKEQYGEGNQETPAGQHAVADGVHGMGSDGVEVLEEAQADAREGEGGTGGLHAREEQGGGGEAQEGQAVGNPAGPGTSGGIGGWWLQGDVQEGGKSREEEGSS